MFLRLKKTIFLAFCLSFFAGVLVQGMMEDDNESCFLSPVKSSSRPVEPLSSSKKPIKKWVGHHCYKVLSAISKNESKRAQDAFREFFAMIPYDEQNVKKKKNDPNYTKNYYYALFYTLSRCLERCATGESDGETNIKILKATDNKPGVIYIPLEHNDNVFVIQFCVCNENQLKTRQSLHNKDHVASIYVTVCLDGGGKYRGATVESQSDVNLSSSLRINLDKPIAINQKELRKLDNSQDVYATAIEAIISGNDASSFATLLVRDMADLKAVSKALGLDLRPSCEHYYQCLLANMLAFVLVGDVTSEVKVYNGRIDIKLNLANGEVIIFELKYKKSVREALCQIFIRNYGIADSSSIKKAVGINLTEEFEVEVKALDYPKEQVRNGYLDRVKNRVAFEKNKRSSDKREKEIAAEYFKFLARRERDESGNDEKEAFEKKRRKFN
ncbi:MAG: PD-(D/E)XK nuclease domain-containing protein [bacterium]